MLRVWSAAVDTANFGGKLQINAVVYVEGGYDLGEAPYHALAAVTRLLQERYDSGPHTKFACDVTGYATLMAANQ